MLKIYLCFIGLCLITLVCMLQIINLLLPTLVGDDSDIILEVNAGVGGQEAMLFTKELFDMYMKYALYKGWTVNIVSYDETDFGKYSICVLYFAYYTYALIKTKTVVASLRN